MLLYFVQSPTPNLVSRIHYKGRFREQDLTIVVISASFGPERVAQMPDIPTYSTYSN